MNEKERVRYTRARHKRFAVEKIELQATVLNIHDLSISHKKAIMLNAYHLELRMSLVLFSAESKQ